ncbi:MULTISPECIES: hypothetical protein [Flavobacterium]|uniref:Uncharacterized protein n=1 Tax=Flavobacterium jumunjinense TaxID=998845 RepID=A0ABV5GM24_9FLAO|nr:MULTISPECIES: hypothetical protein [Flavobacterium]
MKIFSIIVIAIATLLIVFNFTKLDFNNLLEGDSTVALIGIISGFCAILLMSIYLVSKKIENKSKNN